MSLSPLGRAPVHRKPLRSEVKKTRRPRRMMTRKQTQDLCARAESVLKGEAHLVDLTYMNEEELMFFLFGKVQDTQ